MSEKETVTNTPLTTNQIIEYINQCRDMIDKYGHFIQGVGGNEDEPAYCYSVGMAEKQKPDAILIGLLEPSLIAEYMTLHAEQPLPFVFSSESMAIEVNGQEQPARFKAVEIDVEKVRHLALACFNTELVKTPQTKFIQLLLADVNNILPDEEGFTPFPYFVDCR